MAIVSRFTDPVQLEIAHCPLARSVIPSEDTGACAGCTFNVVFPGEPRIGCSTRTPIDVYDAAVAALASSDARLSDELSILCRNAHTLAADDPRVGRWLSLGEAWYAIAKTDEERELSSVIARFAQKSTDRGVGVVILG
ncbi:MAG: hypothetical protein HYV07_33350 [Deltaproteobacteria bacterium]|nr:hypothetical protein [Deltaproteobacteria bacterium]